MADGARQTESDAINPLDLQPKRHKNCIKLHTDNKSSLKVLREPHFGVYSTYSFCGPLKMLLDYRKHCKIQTIVPQIEIFIAKNR